MPENRDPADYAPTSYEKRFANADLIHAYAKDNSPRKAEIIHLFDELHRVKANRVLNVPFEGNLIKNIAQHEEITFADFVVSDSMKSWNIIKTDCELNGLQSNYFDAVLSVAGIHHLTDHDQFKFLLGTKRVLRPSGWLLMVEVKSQSPTSRFLDDFVGRHTPSGHSGNYLRDTFADTVALAEYTNIKRETIPHEWVFTNKDHMSEWMTIFFGLSDISKTTLLDQAESILGMHEREQMVTVNWLLDFVSAQKS